MNINDEYRNKLTSAVPPYVGMASKQNGGYNAGISIQTSIFHLI